MGSELKGEVLTLTGFQYAEPVKGMTCKLYNYDSDGHLVDRINFKDQYQMDDVGVWTAKAAQVYVDAYIKMGNEIRVTDCGDMLIFHAKDGKVIYPESGVDFWSAI